MRGTSFETRDLDVPEITDTKDSADNIIRLREIELEHEKEENRFTDNMASWAAWTAFSVDFTWFLLKRVQKTVCWRA
jgi:hypothetical protein